MLFIIVKEIDMAKDIPVSYMGKHKYDIKIRHDFNNIIEAIQSLRIPSNIRLCIVTDSNVSKYHLDSIKTLLSTQSYDIYEFIFNAGEQYKNLETVNKLYTFLIENHFDRNDFLIALGGGVVGDLTGFAAATYLRGIRFIQVPTTLLSQVDSSIGGKTGVDCMQYKNMVGAFYQPSLVYINLSTLNTLPDTDYYSGMGEIIKHSLIADCNYYNLLKNSVLDVKRKDLNVLEDIIYKSCLIKRDVVEKDPKELGLRANLNFGHTIGHAIEKLTDFSLLHGYCVAIGCVAAGYICMRLGNISNIELIDIQNLIKSYNLYDKINNSTLDSNDILKATKSDKKMDSGKIKFVLLKAIGEAYISKEISDEMILEAINYVNS